MAAPVDVSVGGAAEAAVEPAEERPERTASFLPWSKQERRQRWAQAKRIESGDHDRHRDGHRELLVEPAGDARDKRRRNEHGGENQRDRDHRPGDLFHRLKSRIPRRHSLLDVVLDGFHDDDRIVHYEADRQHQPKQR